MSLPAAGLIIAAAPATERRRCRGRPPAVPVLAVPVLAVPALSVSPLRLAFSGILPEFLFVGPDRARSNFVVGTLPIRSVWEVEMWARSKA